jgi:hypothetical protein
LVDGEPEALPQLRQRVAGPQIRPLAAALGEMREDLPRQLVTLLRTAPLRQQTRPPGNVEGRVRLVGGGQRDAEELRCHRHRHGLEAMTPHRLVAHLQKIARIEEEAAAKGPSQHLDPQHHARAVTPKAPLHPLRQAHPAPGGWLQTARYQPCSCPVAEKPDPTIAALVQPLAQFESENFGLKL